MYKNKRGLSDVVTTVLIILLAIAAVLIVWSFVKPAIQKAGESLTTSCIELELEPTSCDYDSTSKNATVKYRWKGGDVDLTEVKLGFKYGDETIVRSTSTIPGGILEGATASANLTGVAGTPSEVRVAGVVLKENGETNTCDFSPKTVVCN